MFGKADLSGVEQFTGGIVEFNPIILTVGKMSARLSKSIREEPMIWSGDYQFARSNGGELTQEFLDKISSTDRYKSMSGVSDLNFVLDSRVTHIMPGQYPSMGGWHCDDFTRKAKYAQPRIEDRDKRICHFVALVGDAEDGNSCTEFVTEKCKIPVDQNAVWNSLDHAIENQYSFLKRSKAKNLDIVYFNQDAIHRATAATTAGWRLFIRGSFTYREPQNEIRKQVQVYLDKKGW